MPDEELWNTAQCAKFLAISVHTLRAWKARGAIPFVQIEGTVRYSPSAVREWAASKAVPAGVAEQRAAV